MLAKTDETYAVSDTTGLTARQERGIAALLQYPTIRQAAKAAGVSEGTVYRWKHDPVFADALRAAQRERMQMAVGYLQAGTADALDALRSIFNDKQQPATARVSSASKWIAFALRTYYDLDEVDQLIEQLRDGIDSEH